MCVVTGEGWEEAMDGGGEGGGASQGLQGTTRLLVTGGRWADGWTPAWLLVEPVLLCVAVVSLVGAVRNTLTT